MPLQYTTTTQTGTSGTDYLIGMIAGPNFTLNGGDGNDFLIGDYGFAYLDGDHAGNNSIANAYNLETSSALWYTEANPLIFDGGATPYTTIHLTGEGSAEYFAVTVGAGETITVDTDASEFDTVVHILDAAGNELAVNDDGTYASDTAPLYTSVNRTSFVDYTNTTAGDLVLYVRVGQFGGTNLNSGIIGSTEDSGDIAIGNETLVHVSVTGHATTGNPANFTAGNDTLNGGNGNDQMFGMDGNDTFIGADGDGNDYIDGGDGADTLLYNGVTTDLTIDLSNKGAQNTGGAGTDTILNIETIVSGSGNDILTAAASGSGLFANQGNDTLIGGAGNDTLRGAQGMDNVTGGAGNDRFDIVGTDVVAGEVYDGGADIDKLFFYGSTEIIADFRLVTTVQNFEEMGFSGSLTNGATVQMNSTQWAANVFTQIDSDARSGAAAAVNLEIYIDATTVDMDLSGLIFDANWDQSRDTITVEGDAADNDIIGTSQTDTLNGGDGDDTFTVNTGAHFEELGETIAGGAGFDRLILNDVTGPIDMTDMANVSGVEALLVAGDQNADITLSLAYNSANLGLSIEDALAQGDASLTPFSTLSRTTDINGIQYLLDESLVTTSGNRIGIFEDGSNGDFTLDTSGFVLNQSTFVVVNADGGNTNIATGNGEDIIVLATGGSSSVDLTTATGTTSVNGGAFSDPGDEDILVLNTNGTGSSHLLGDAMQNIERVVVNIGSSIDASITMDASYTGDNLIIDGRGITTEWSSNDLFFNGAANAAGEDLTVYGTQNNDTIQGGLGDDILDGGDGIDTLSFADFVATTGTDGVSVSLFATGAQDTGSGMDTISNFEMLITSDHDDFVNSSTGQYTSVSMGAGNDLIQGNSDNGYTGMNIDAGAGDDAIRIFVATSADFTGTTFDGGAGNDELDVVFVNLSTDLRGANFANIETLNLFFTTSTGSGLRELAINSSQLETFSSIYAAQGPGAADNALLSVTVDSALVDLSALTFSNFNDAEVTTRIEGLSTANNITGSVLDDIIIGSNVADTLNGFDGDDTFMGGGGNDAMNGGDGDDLVDYSGATNRVDVNLLSGNGSGNQAQGDTYVSIEDIIGSNLGDTLRGNNSDNRVEGGNGNDILIGFNGADILLGGAGRDILNGGDGADFLQGGAGVDMARYNGSSEGVQINLASGTATGGQAEGDTLLNIENLFGSNHGDTLIGNSQNNKLFGHNGDDSLLGNGGISKLYGGAGNDSFFLSDGFAFVMDFVDDVDMLDVSNYGFATLADALENVDQVGNHARFRFDGDVLLVLNTDMNDLMDDIVI